MCYGRCVVGDAQRGPDFTVETISLFDEFGHVSFHDLGPGHASKVARQVDVGNAEAQEGLKQTFAKVKEVSSRKQFYQILRNLVKSEQITKISTISKCLWPFDRWPQTNNNKNNSGNLISTPVSTWAEISLHAADQEQEHLW